MNMKLRLILATATILAVAVTGSRAADLSEPATSEPAAYDWSGIYFGGHAGYGSADVEYQFPDDQEGIFDNGERAVVPLSPDGFIGGAHIGANWQVDNFVLGLEGSFTWTGLDDVNRGAILDDNVFEPEIEWVATVTPRLGFAFDNILLYAKGGVAFGEIDARITESNVFAETEKTQTGWTVGGGAEYALTDRVILGVEGNYYDFGSFDANQDTRNLDDGSPSLDTTHHDVDADMWAVLVRLSFKL